MESKSLFDAPDIQKEFLFECKNKQELDKTKENLVIFTRGVENEYSHLFGFIEDVIKVIKNEFNLIYITTSKNLSNIPNYYKLNLGWYQQINHKKFKRKKEDPNSVNHNRNIIFEEFEKCFDFKVDKILFVEDMWHILPMRSYVSKKENPILHERLNEFHDYVGNDEEMIKEIRKHIKRISEHFDENVSILAFSMFRTNLMLNLVRWFHERNPIKMLYTFNIDPATWLHFFEYYKIPTTNFYFENDKRGTRNFTKFPIAHLEHIIFEPRKLGKVKSLEKSKDFFFIGTVLKQKGDRIQVWETFLRDLRLDNSVMYIPDIANIIYKNKKAETSAAAQKKAAQAKELFADTLQEMKDNPMWKGHILPENIPFEISKYKYGFIARCVSFEDSINYRPVFYAYLDILPFIDSKYDPEYLQVPKHIQDRIVCRDYTDIEKWTKYYNEHDNERLALIKELREHFEVDDFEKNWKETVKSYFI